jgi:hypothetical protein
MGENNFDSDRLTAGTVRPSAAVRWQFKAKTTR